MIEDDPCGETETAVEVIARLEDELNHVEELFDASCKDNDALRDRCLELTDKWKKNGVIKTTDSGISKALKIQLNLCADALRFILKGEP